MTEAERMWAEHAHGVRVVAVALTAIVLLSVSAAIALLIWT